MDQRDPRKPISTDLPFRDQVQRSFQGDGGTRSRRPLLNYSGFGQRMESSTAPQKGTDIPPSSPDTSTDLPFRDQVHRSFQGDGGTRSSRPLLNYSEFGQRMESSTAPYKGTDIAPSSPHTAVNNPSHQPDDTPSSPDTIVTGSGEPTRQDLRLQPETKDLVHQILDGILADPKVAAALVCDIMGKLDEEAQLRVWQTCLGAMSDDLRKRIMDRKFL